MVRRGTVVIPVNTMAEGEEQAPVKPPFFSFFMQRSPKVACPRGGVICKRDYFWQTPINDLSLHSRLLNVKQSLENYWSFLVPNKDASFSLM